VIEASSQGKRDLVTSASPSHHRVASIAIDKSDGISVSKVSRASRSSGFKSNASLFLPFLHCAKNDVTATSAENSVNSVRDDSLRPSPVGVFHSSAGETGNAGVFVVEFVLKRIHIHVHLNVDHLAFARSLSGASCSASISDDFIHCSVIFFICGFLSDKSVDFVRRQKTFVAARGRHEGANQQQ